jgi:solute carrier family 39 (zinc transporter), member 1/2/3
MFSTFTVRYVFLSWLVASASAQITLTGCHIHDGQEYVCDTKISKIRCTDSFRVCLLPGDVETTISSTGTAASSPSPTAPISITAETTATAQTTAITDCHSHDATQYVDVSR